MRNQFLVVVFLSIAACSFAQDKGKSTISFVPFSYTPATPLWKKNPIGWFLSGAITLGHPPKFYDSKDYVPEMEKAVWESFAKYNNLAVVYTNDWGFTGKKFPNAEEQLEAFRSRAKIAGISYLVSANVSPMQVWLKWRVIDIFGNYFHNHTEFYVTFKVTRIDTNKYFNSMNMTNNEQVIKAEGSVRVWGGANVVNDMSLGLAIAQLKKKANLWMQNAFPAEITLSRLSAAGNTGSEERIMAQAASTAGRHIFTKGIFRRKRKFVIVEYAVDSVNGEENEKTVRIGQAKVSRVQKGGLTAQCKITDGFAAVNKELAGGKKLFLVPMSSLKVIY